MWSDGSVNEIGNVVEGLANPCLVFFIALLVLPFVIWFLERRQKDK